MEGWLSPKEEPTPVVVQDSIPTQPQIIINNIVEKKEAPKVIVKEVEKKEDENNMVRLFTLVFFVSYIYSSGSNR